MRTHFKMTIQDYFRKSGVHPSSAEGRAKDNAGTASGVSFSRALAAAQETALTGSGPRGLSIRDYAAKPMPVRALGRWCPHPLIEAGTASPDGGHQLSNSDIADTAGTAPVNAKGNSSPAPELKIRDEEDKISVSIQRAAERYDLPASLIRAVVQAESSYQVRAVSPAGAQGLMQLMPATAKELGVEDPFDIDQNIDGGAKYLRKMLDRFNGDVKLALSAYNAGPGAVAKFNGNVPYTETRHYVERVLRYTRQFS